MGYDPNAWRIVSSVMGWVYFAAWSLSFYPQLILNYRRKSVQGLSMDFIYLNLLGFLCYSIYNLSFFCSNEIQEQYKQRNNGNENLVRANDVVFALHAFFITLLTFLQTFIYKKDEGQRVSRFARLLIAAALFGAILLTIIAGAGAAKWIDLMYYLSYVKLAISIIKYIPQAWLNYRRKSTIGWSIHNILLDFTGGVLSIAQLLLDAGLSGDWGGVTGNPVKFGLGFVAIAFDLLFMTQHYILYRDRKDFYLNTVDEERRRLLTEGRVPRDEDEEEII